MKRFQHNVKENNIKQNQMVMIKYATAKVFCGMYFPL